MSDSKEQESAGTATWKYLKQNADGWKLASHGMAHLVKGDLLNAAAFLGLGLWVPVRDGIRKLRGQSNPPGP